MSVAMTVEQVIAQTKTVTRRKGWWRDKNGRRLLRVGDHLDLVEKSMGFRPGERGGPVLATVEVVSISREPLDVLTFDEPEKYGATEVAAEGFPGMDPEEFIQRFFVRAQGFERSDEVTRIEWRYLDE